MSCYFDISGGRCWCRGEGDYCGETKITKTLQEAKEQDSESSKGNTVMKKSVKGLWCECEEKRQEGHRRGKEQIIWWHWAVKGRIKLQFRMYSNVAFEFESSIHCMPSLNSLFLVNTDNGAGWSRSIFWMPVPASISKVMLKKAVALALAHFLYSLSLRESILAEHVWSLSSKLYDCGKTVTERTWLQGNKFSCSIANMLSN